MNDPAFLKILLICQNVNEICHLKDRCHPVLSSVLDQMELLLEGVTVISISASVGEVAVEAVGG